MGSHSRAWIIFGIGITLLVLKGFVPEFNEKYEISVPILNFGNIEVSGTLGFIFVFFSILRLLDIIPEIGKWSQKPSKK